MKIHLANPRGFCAGVDRAIDIVERAISLFGAPIHVRHEVVHNRYVVERLRALEAARRGLNVFDATCPLVTKVHMEVTRYAREGYEVILIGHEGHPEVEGTLGQIDASGDGRIHLIEHERDVAGLEVRDPSRLGFVTQTTLSVDDTTRIVECLQARFPALASPRKEDICYATQNRQDAVKTLVASCEVLIVVGSSTSSNSNRLREIAEKQGGRGYLVDGAADLRREWLEGVANVGVTAGASAPEVLVREVGERLQSWGGEAAVEVPGRAEHVVFALPRPLRGVARQG
ncbi:MAG: 4-hydroxy-3-methylbut-2-enyl diphosphate reductase [Proteobacteria bacterium]|nr:4-hydroxy-3-methylbut-2-enyl diphosphate reductase [Pseudomonadota bacterium]